MLDLESVDFFGDGDNGFGALLEVWCQGGYRVGFLLEDEGGKQRDYFFGLEVCQDILEDEFRQDELGRRMDLKGRISRSFLADHDTHLAGYFALKLDS